MSDHEEREQHRATGSAWAPFTHTVFAVLWTATVISNVGTWMHDVASGWLMTSLTPSPLMVALVQAATSAPIFLFALAAGALADLVSRRKLLIVVMAALSVTTLILASLVFTEKITPGGLLLFTFLSGTGAAFIAPAWQSIVPQLVPRPDLQSAIALNGVGINVSRAIGPALAGAIIAAFGIGWPYLVNALSFLVVIAALLWWKPSPPEESDLPAERFWSAMRAGMRYVRASGAMRATLIRAVAFFLFVSAFWALLPLVAREELQGGPQLYGAILTAVGIGAVAGAAFLPRLVRKFSSDQLVLMGTLGTGLVLVTLALIKRADVAIAACLLAGACWITVLSRLNISAQLALPDWVRARGLSIFITFFFGAMTFGSILWGQVASHVGISYTQLIAAGGSVLAGALSWHFRLLQDEGLDHTPSGYWPQPLVAKDVGLDHGPVMVTVEYRIDISDTAEFVTAMRELKASRERHGAFAWGLFEDVAEPGRMIEYFIEESWVAHLRHHQRISVLDSGIQQRARDFHRGGVDPVVTHLLAPEPGRAPPVEPIPARGSIQ
ncbi:MFS transporter [Microbulbifer rhizosphaerae]|uniref:MFS family permease n=1 Tax=Microbulbifer rhizosphaerae TaxID=1562603 RepID=A0A7W4WAB2_9GAMM|nr:MFS transporter [Microbulbifer rhizosphaerae]MBB3060082.1 MFS family permease [Microbulbifer rhizosphaerae]